MKRSERGSALLTVVIVVLLISGLAAGLFLLVMAQNRMTFRTASGMDAYYVAQAGVGNALQELRSGTDVDGAGLGTTSGSFAGGDYSVVATDPGDGTILLTAVARKNEVRRGLEVRVRMLPPVPVPGLNAQAAVAFYGDLDKKGKLDLHIKHHENDKGGDDDDPDSSSTSTSPVAIDGNDQAGGPSLPGVGIEDPLTYDRITDKIAKKISDGKIPADAIIGAPMVQIGDGKDTAIASFAQLSNPTLSAETMGAIAGAIEDVVDTQLIPNADGTLTGNNVTINSALNFGTQAFPTVEVVDGNRMTLGNGGSISGNGILIITGDLKMNKNSSINWNGSIIIMGGRNRDAVLQNNQGELNVNGNILVLGTSDRMKKSVLKIHNDHDLNEATTTINGAVLVITGDRTDKAEKAEVKFKHGVSTINGFVSVVGDKAKFDVHTHDKGRDRDGGFTLNGGVALSVWDNDDKHKAKVHLHGENILVHYHSANVQAALDGLMSLANMDQPVIPPTWTVVSWREIPAPTNILP